VAHTQAGDHLAGTLLYRQHAPEVYRYLLVALKSPEDAEDATQQVFLKLFEALPAYRPAEPFEAWLFTLVRNVAIDCLRRAGRSCPADPHSFATRTVASRDLAPCRDAADESSVRDIIHALPELQQRTLVLLYLDDVSAEEAGRRLGRSPGAIRQVHRRALRTLAAQLVS
jgi:RNA polymerase sigma-70 factor, ECF subfamily